jgi:hypothetical protein
MVNFGLNSASILGIFLAVAGASLYFLRSVRPELSRDHDIFFAAVGLLCGFILLFQGWRLDPILQFGQFLLTGSTIFFAVESIRLRGVATEQARRNTRIVDDERPVSKVYRTTADLDEYESLEPYDEEVYDNPRLRGYQEPNRPRPEDIEERPPRSRRSSSSRPSRPSGERPPSRRPSRRPSSTTATSRGYENGDAPADPRYNRYSRYDEWSEEETDVEPRPTSKRPRRSRPPVRPAVEEETTPNLRKRQSPRVTDLRSTEDEEPAPADYVDYQPIEPQDFEDENEGLDEDDEPNLSGSEY